MLAFGEEALVNEAHPHTAALVEAGHLILLPVTPPSRSRARATKED